MTSENKTPRLLSVIVPCYNEEEVFPDLKEALESLMGDLADKYRLEIILIDDGSTDGTWNLMLDFALQDSRICAISLSRNFGHQAALTCGYDLATGDAVVTMDADLQDPIETVFEMLRAFEGGADVVFAVRESRAGETKFKLWTAALYYQLLRHIGQYQAPQDSGEFRLMSRRATEALRKLREHHRYIRGMAGWIGFKTDVVRYQRRSRRLGVTKWPFRKMMRFAVDGIVSSSMIPLRFAYVAALLSVILFGGYGVYTLGLSLFFDSQIVRGWPSLFGAVVALGLMNLVSLGLVGEYLGRVYEQSKARPIYLVQDKIWNGARIDGFRESETSRI